MSKILKLQDVMEVTALSRSSIYAFIKTKNFPKPISLGLRAVGWLESDVQAWIATRIDASRGEVSNAA